MKLANFKNPLSGATGNLLNVSDWTTNILGVVFLFVVIAMGQMVSRKVSGAIPAIDTTIEPIISQPAQSIGLQKYTY